MFRKKLPIIVSIFLLIGGTGALLYYPVQSWMTQQSQKQEQASFDQARKEAREAREKGKEVSDTEDNPYEKLFQDMERYNRELYLTGQKGLKDAWSYEQPIFVMENYGVGTEVIGSLKIEAMDLETPVLLGATQDHMARGAVVLGQTSMPVGGENTNCVIAGHRGMGSVPMFQEIEKLKKGDTVVLETLWDTLVYQVSEIRIILPDDIDAVKIQEDQELLTLITCHPYRHNSHRYVVYCERQYPKDTDKDEEAASQTADRHSPWVLRLEKVLPLAAIPLLAGCVLLLIPGKRKKDGRDRRR